MTRFFVTARELHQDAIILQDENADHAKVLRLKTGEQVLACDGEGTEALCVLSEINVLSVVERRPSATEAGVKVSVHVAFPKADKLEHIIQKATELGAYEIVAFIGARSISKPDEKSLPKKIERWQKIARSAAEQSGRGVIPQVVVQPNLKAALSRGGEADLPILFYENEHSTTLKMALDSKPYKTVAILSGPEGGFEEQEVREAEAAGFRICTLGSRILRCETAPLCGLSAIMFHSDEY